VPIGTRIGPNIDQATPEDINSYQQQIGSLMYLTTKTRPDLAFSIGLLARYMANPGPEHWKTLERLWAYVYTTKNIGLYYQSTSELPTLIGYTDADWGGDLATRRSTTAYIYLFMGGPLSWTSKLQRTVALSSCEAEYMAIKEAIKENLFIRSILNEIAPILEVGTYKDLYTDSNSAIELAKHASKHNRTKHIDIQYHFIREKVKSNDINLLYIPTTKQLANSLTKPVDQRELSVFKDQIGLQQLKVVTTGFNKRI